MDSAFVKWIEIEMNHSYFGNKGFEMFRVQPLGGTIRQLKNYGLVLHKSGNSISSYYEVIGQDSQDSSEALNGLRGICLELIFDDLLFFQYSDIPFPTENELLCFFNNPESSKHSSESSIPLNCEIVKICSGTILMDLPEGEVEMLIKHKSTDQQKSITVSPEADRNVLFDLHGFEEGVVEVSVNGQIKEHLYISNHPTSNVRSILFLSVHDLHDVPLKFNMSIGSKNVFFEYKVVLKDSRELEINDISILGSDNTQYEEIGEEMISKGALAKLFVSQAPIEMKLNVETPPTLKLSYSSSFSKEEKTLELALPNPAPENIMKYGKTSDNKWLASTIVYV